MNIGIDIDGTIADFSTTYLDIVNKKFNTSLEKSQLREHDLYKLLGLPVNEAGIELGLTLSKDLPLIEGAKDVIERLYEYNRIIIITARSRDFEGFTKKWLESKDIKYHKLYFSKEGKKGEIEPLHILVEDNIKEVIHNIGKVDHLLLFDQPWNKSLNVGNYFTRVHTWKEIYEQIKGIGEDERTKKR